jgi:hypothetical protein
MKTGDANMRIHLSPTTSAISALALSFFALTATAADLVISPSARMGLDLTIYNNNLALIRDTREIDFSKGPTTLQLPGVTEAINPSSVFFEQTPARALNILEVNFDAKTLSWDYLLRKAIGQTVRFKSKRRDDSTEHPSEGVLLDVSGSYALVESNGEARNLSKNKIILSMPPGPRQLKPSLSVRGVATSNAKTNFALTYMTGGLSWRSDYVGRLNMDETALQLSSYVTLNNTTSAGFEKARVRVVAGTVNQTRRAQPRRGRIEALASKAFSAQDVVETPVSDVHVISVGENLTLGPKQSKQIALFQADSIPVVKEYRLENNSASYNRAYPAPLRDNPTIRYIFKNDAKSELGRVLPAGVIRLYAQTRKAPVFVGETSLPHTARGETVRLATGRAFEITAERRQTHYRRSGLPKGVFESEHEIKIRNGKKKPVSVYVNERIPGEWRILSESQSHETPQSNIAVWRVDVPANGEASIRYSVRVQF